VLSYTKQSLASQVLASSTDFYGEDAMRPKLIITFQRYTDADFLAKAGFILASLAGNAHFPEPWPPQAPALGDIRKAYNAYRDSYNASLTRDSLKIRQRKADREALTQMLKQLAPYLELVAKGDAMALASSGYDLRQEVVRNRANGTLPAPSDFTVKHGPNSGTLLIHAARLAGAGSYEVQIAQGDPTVEANWRHALSSKNCSHILLEGLTPAQTHWVRMRGIGSQGPGVWTEPVSIIVV
jgi:hypothetical protein